MVLEQKLSKNIDLLAWPFGIYDDRLIAAAQEAGYRAAFTLDRRPPARNDRALALPRYLMTDSMQGAAFEKFLDRATQETRP
jgi:peptidoglycan/xylan/chitin deacetylase (PgdA/CDA1 family)